MLAEFFVFALGFVVSYTDLIALVPSRQMFVGRERAQKVGVTDFRNSCANQNRVHFVIFPRLYVRRELEAATVWCETRVSGAEKGNDGFPELYNGLNKGVVT